jgi:isocitrate dehydrogenase
MKVKPDRKIKYQAPKSGQEIKYHNRQMIVPDHLIIPFIIGDGTGPDIWRASRPVFDAALERAYQGARKVYWMEILAGEKAFKKPENGCQKKRLEIGQRQC